MKIHELFDKIEEKDKEKAKERWLKLVPCTPYKSGKKSRRVRKNTWVPR